MTRKLIVLFVVLILCFYSLISSFLGERGFLVNNSLKRQLKENEYELDRKDVEIENLEIQEKELSSEDGLRSAAMGLGYQVESDDVYVFPTEDKAKSSESTASTTSTTQSKDAFRPWSKAFTLLISFVASTIITVLMALISHRKGKIDDSEQEESGNSGDDFDNDK